MSKLDEITIGMVEMNMQYIKSGLNNNKPDCENAAWIYYLIKSYSEAVDAAQRVEAIEQRNRLNSGYSKAGH